ncbi:MAG: YbgC/FadM family acyl-CoA thioesterase [Lutibacter sp.]|uniref:acyl-CoA thioesterase n=1 Tax=Lutibacter sp. TaxID=1925666 RepID=UPI0019E4A7E1|nr:thioesterase family protein [Lutibacter sp.]NOR28310.1 YbgC/FadM family acyl-CoA thioesterase [Lutibacter sp.]
MIFNKIQFRVRYAETDQMSFAYHGNYVQYYEMGRIEWLRKLDISYKKMEEAGVMLPVISLNINYIKPAKYDDLLTLKTTLINNPLVKIKFEFEIHNENNELLNTANVTLAFMDSITRKPVRAPKYLLEKIQQNTI